MTQPTRPPAELPPQLLRLTIRTALGQILNGLPDLAAGTIACLHPADIGRIAEAAINLHLIAAEQTPEGKQATADYNARTPADGQAYNDAQLFLAAWRGEVDKLRETTAGLDHAHLIRLRNATSILAEAIEHGLGFFMPAGSDD